MKPAAWFMLEYLFSPRNDNSQREAFFSSSILSDESVPVLVHTKVK